MIKLSAVICEFNPFHNGHAYNLSQAKKQGDSLIVIQSGNFTQRGEIAVLDKYTRAKHAILAGADMVIELPCVYATANAEIFALGGIKLFNLINASTLCFGAEKDDKDSFLQTARACLRESKNFKKELKNNLKLGYKFVKAKSLALSKEKNVDCDLLEKPNNILGLEYTKALLKSKKPFNIYPIKRIGEDFNSTDFSTEFSSASGIRQAISLNQDVSLCVPDYVFKDLPKDLPNLDKEIIYSILNKSPNELKNLPDVSEGLENRIYNLAQENYTFNTLINSLCTKRYTKTRLQRILINNLLNIDKNLISVAKKTTPYVKVLAIKKDKLNLLGELSKSCTLITQRSDTLKLNKNQKLILERDIFSSKIYSLITNNKQNSFEMKIID